MNNKNVYIAVINKVSYIQYIIIIALCIKGLYSTAEYKNMYNYTQEVSMYLTRIVVIILLFYSIVNLFEVIIKVNTTKLYFNDKIIYGKVGLLKTISLETPLNKINDIMIIQNLGGKILNYSTIRIFTSSNKYDFKYIKNANEFKNRLQESINK